MELIGQISEAQDQALQELWCQLAKPYGAAAAVDAAWKTLRKAYTARARHYHNLAHIQALLNWAERYQAQLVQYDAVRFAIWYHDVIYQTRKHDNEERSAALAEQELPGLNVPAGMIPAVTQMIRATKTHQANELSADGRWFLDFDLSILGSAPDVYQAYSRAIRREYRWVPALLYRRGRRQVLEGFLQREQLFFTEPMRQALETQARTNLCWELAQLA